MRTALGLLKRRWRPFFLTSALALVRVLVGFVLLIVPGFVVWIRKSMWAPVVLMEGLGPKAALRRSRELAARSWFPVSMTVAFQLALPWLFEGAKAANRVWPGYQPGPVERALVELPALSSVFLLPLLSTVPALLYLELRRLGGETMEQILEPLGDDLGRASWERRIRSRRVHPAASSGPGPTPHP